MEFYREKRSLRKNEDAQGDIFNLVFGGIGATALAVLYQQVREYRRVMSGFEKLGEKLDTHSTKLDKVGDKLDKVATNLDGYAAEIRNYVAKQDKHNEVVNEIFNRQDEHNKVVNEILKKLTKNNGGK